MAHPATQRRPGDRPTAIYDLTPLVLENIAHLGLDYLVPIGGDDTLSFAACSHDEGVPLIAIPKTMDNDVQGTEYCIGFSTAITRAKELINRQRTTLGSHERIGVFRIFGRDAGFTALYTAYVTSAPLPDPRVRRSTSTACAEILVEDQRNNPSRLRLRHRRRGRDVEGRRSWRRSATADAFGHRHKANIGGGPRRARSRRRTGIETRGSAS